MLRQTHTSETVSPRRRKGWLRGALALALACALLAPLEIPLLGGQATPAAAAQDPNDPWPAGAAGGNFEDWAPTVFIGQRQPTHLFRVEQTVDVNDQNQTTGTGKFTSIGVLHNSYNALAYRSADDYLYAMRVNGAENKLLRIGQQGVSTQVAGVSGLPSVPDAGNWNAGTFGEGVHAGVDYSDQYFIRASSGLGKHLYKVDASTLPAGIEPNTDLAVVDMTLSHLIPNTADLVYKDGYIWTFDRVQTGQTGRVYRIEIADPNNDGIHEVAQFSLNYGYNNLVFGAQWSYGNGNVGLSDNNSGHIFQYEIQDASTANPKFIAILAEPLKGGKSTLNDGTSKISPGVDLKIEKHAPATSIAGASFEFTLTVTNQSPNWSSGFVVTDVVPAGFTNVQALTSGCNALALTPAGSGTEVKCVGGMLAPHTSVEMKIRATLPVETEPNVCVPNTASVLGNEAEVDDSDNESTASVCPAAPGLKVEKAVIGSTGDPSFPRVGDTLTYQVDITNIGDSNYSAGFPAVVTDDLSGVLDDSDIDLDPATFKILGTGGGTLAYDAPRVTWSGPLNMDDVLSFTFDVTLKKGGDGEVRNVAFEGEGDTPLCEPRVADGDGWIDETTGVPCAITEHLMPRLSITKVANLPTLPEASGNIRYTIKVKNEGPGNWSSTDAAMTDRLDALLPAAEIISGTVDSDVPTATLNATDNRVEWAGELLSGAEATITFEVEYDPVLDVPGILTNTACVPEADALPGVDHCASVTLKSKRTSQWKEVSASSDPILTGTDLTYTLHFANNGTLDFEVDAIDYLGDVIDDAELVSGPDVSMIPPAAGPLVATYEPLNERITIIGTLLPGESATVTYTVTVKAEIDRGNNRAVNFLLDVGAPPPGVDPPEECVPAADRPICTDTQLPGSIIWQKTDEYETLLAGSEWLLTPVDSAGQPTADPAIAVTDCIAATAGECTGPDVDPTAGSFNVIGLTYGFYTLTETVSPAGYMLDTMPLARVALVSSVLDLGIFLNFQHWVPEIPLTGGLGTYMFTTAGLLALATMVGLLFWRARRRHA